MILYHTSTLEIRKPDLLHSRPRLDFGKVCRKGLPHKDYDIIEGGIADDQVFDTVDLYFSGIYTREQALDQLQFKKPNHQICITSQETLDKYLHFQSSKKL